MKNTTVNEVKAIMKGNGLCSIMLIALVVFNLGMFAQPARAQLPGAIFTTLLDGTRINANIYEIVKQKGIGLFQVKYSFSFKELFICLSSCRLTPLSNS